MTTLTQPMFEILAAVAQKPLHGYAISKRIAQAQGGDVKPMGPATLYTTIQKLMGLGWIEEVEVVGGDVRRGKSYRLTQGGRTVLTEEMVKRRQFLDIVGLWVGAETQS